MGQVLTSITTDGSGMGTHVISNSFYGTCNTENSLSTKEILISNSYVDEIYFVPGMLLTVKFTYENTNPYDTYFTLYDSSGTTVIGAQTPVYALGSENNVWYATTNPVESYSWAAGAIVGFVYTNEGWVMLSTWDKDTTYSTMTSTDLNTGTSTTGKLISAKVLSDYTSSLKTLETSTGHITLGGTGTNYFLGNGLCATLMSAGNTPSATWGSASVCTIPEGYRPWTTLYFPVQKDGAIASDTYLTIGSDGNVTIQNGGGTQASVGYRCTATWALNGISSLTNLDGVSF